MVAQNDNKKKSESVDKENAAIAKLKACKIWLCVGLACVLLVVVWILLAVLSMETADKGYEVIIEGVDSSAVSCNKSASGAQITCEGEVVLPARLNAKGEVATTTLEVVATGGELADGAGVIAGKKLTNEDYASLRNAQGFDGNRVTLAKLERGKQIPVVYMMNVKYTLSDADRAILADLDNAYQKEQEIKRQEEERKRQEAERLEQQRQKEAAAAEQDKKNKSNMQTTAHIVCKRYIENYFFPYSVKIHSILGVGYDKAMGDYTWGYGVNVTVKSAAGGEMKYTVACVAGNFSSDYQSASVIDFGVQSGW